MAHPAQNEFVGRIKAIFPGHFRGSRVLEIGSLDINGTIRALFEGCDYTGIDVGPGPGVDVVCEGQNFEGPDASYDVVISCETMEHNPYWAETFANMVRLAKPGGLIVMTCATTGRKEHGTTRTTPGDSPLTVAKGWNYYRNLTARDFEDAGVLKPLALRFFATSYDDYDLYFVGSKTPATPAQEQALVELKAMYRRRNYGTIKGLKRAFKAACIAYRHSAEAR